MQPPSLTPLPIWPNIKWPKLLINRVPTDNKVAYPRSLLTGGLSQGTLRRELLIHIPQCHTINGPPGSKPPSLNHDGAVSSLSISFEDPNGSRIAALLASKTLFSFGVVTVVKR
jgi:hypothetical protein